MKNTVNETYIANMSAYLHLLSNDEIIEEIRKIRELKNDKSKKCYHVKKRIAAINEAIQAFHKMRCHYII